MTTTNSNVIEMVKGGKRGVTNAQMIPALKENADNKENLVVIYNAFPAVFESSVKYTPDSMKVKLEAFVQEFNPEFTVKTGKKIRTAPAVPALVIADTFKSENNEKLADLVKATANWREVVGEAAGMVEMAIQDKSVAEIGLALGLSKDKVYTVLFRKNGKSVIEKLTNAGLGQAM